MTGARQPDSGVRGEHQRSEPGAGRLPASAIRTAIWTDVARTADEFNSPGVFTAFSAYEWTAMYEGNNLHRCVILKDNADVVTDWLPYSAQSSSNPEDLWAALNEYEKPDRGRGAVDPAQRQPEQRAHVGHGGAMRAARSTRDYAEARMRWEPIAEVTQLKGDSETHPSLSPDDPFADFERWDEFNISNTDKNHARHVPRLVRALGAAARVVARAQRRRQPLRLWHDRQHGRSHVAGHG